MLDDWTNINAYRNLVAEGLATDFQCAHCDSPACIIADKHLHPRVYCPWCNSTMKPDHRWWARLRAIVREHNV